MQNNKSQDVAFDVDPSFVAEAQQYHRRQEIENKMNPVMRRLPRDPVERANIKEREELERSRRAKDEADRQWKELFA